MPRKPKAEKKETETSKLEAAATEVTVGAEAEQKEKKKRKPKKKVAVVSIRRKESVARAIVKEGKGRVRINKLSIHAIQNPYLKEIMLEPVKMAGDRLNNLDIIITVDGGGAVGQAQAVRTVIAKGVVAYTKDDELRNIYHDYDRFLLVPDPRRVEPKKFKGRKARARFQKSYR
jgi:small subunit ribosomal protein S9